MGTDLAGAVETAIHHYTGKVQSQRRPVSPPQFLSTNTSTDFGTGTSPSPAEELQELELTLDCETEAILRREAMRYGTDVNVIAAHSVMVYLAELDFLSSGSRPL